MELRYNFVIFGSDWDLYKYSYSDLYNKEYVKYFDSLESSLGWFAKFHKFHFSEKTNKLFRLPFKDIWNKYYFRSRFKEQGKPICFVFMGYWPRIIEQTNLVNDLKKQYKQSKFVLFLQDLVKTKQTLYTHEPLQKKHFDYYDMVFSFDHGDCEKYGFIYHPLVFSSYHGEIQQMPQSDIYFLGQPKNRLAEIFEMYEFLTEKGLVVDMNLTNVPLEKRKYENGIHYINWMSYQDNLQHILHTKCLLEVMQKDGKGFTQRCLEAVGLRKKLLTNNSEIKSSLFYEPEFVCQYSNVGDIDDEFIERLKSEDIVRYANEKIISPLSLLEFIDERL